MAIYRVRIYRHDPPCHSECCDRAIGTKIEMDEEDLRDLERQAERFERERDEALAEVERLKADEQNDYKALWKADSAKIEAALAIPKREQRKNGVFATDWRMVVNLMVEALTGGRPLARRESDHAKDCDILTTRDGWEADCTCGAEALTDGRE